MAFRINDVQVWIDSNLARIRGAEDVAAQFKVSQETLRKKFACECGVTLWQYIRARKVERMKHLLVTTDLKCLAICSEIGVGREDCCSRMFRDVTGMTMDEYRRRNGNHAATRSGGGKIRK